MVSCKHCTIQNSLDSTFCKRCGTVLEDADIQEATVKLTALVADGNRMFADGRTEEAMMVAESAVLSNPSSPAALSLKGMCHERLGQIAEALECFERVVEINPDSTLDRLKVNDLRNQLVALNASHQQVRPNQRLAIVAAVAAAFLVISGGAVLAKSNAQARPDAKTFVASNADAGKADGSTTGFTSGGSQAPQTQTQTNPAAGTANPGSATQPPVLNSGVAADQGPALPHPGNGRRLPDLDLNDGQGGVISGPILKPFSPPAPPTKEASPNNDPKKNLPTTGTNVPIDDFGPDPVAEVPKDTNPPGIVDIRISKGGSTGATMGNGRDALVHTARNQFQLGNYDAAARTFERALRSGADQGSTNQRLGQCYERLGKTGEAVEAYKRAASAYENELKSGDNPRVSAALDSCRQALKVLQGN